jgi:hypothetical protein
MQFDRRNRRELIVALGGAAAWPLALHAQQVERLRRIGVLMSYPEGNPEGRADVAAFREGLHKLGWTEGRNIRIGIRWAARGSIQRFAKELVTIEPDLICRRPIERFGDIVAYPILGGLHHRYGRVSRGDHCHLTAYQTSYEVRQSIILILRPVVFDRHILALGIAGFADALSERSHKMGSRVRRRAAKNTDQRHCRLLRPRRERRHRHAADKGDEVAPT